MPKAHLVAHTYSTERVAVQIFYDGPSDEGAYDMVAAHGSFISYHLLELGMRRAGTQLAQGLHHLGHSQPAGPAVVPYERLFQAKRQVFSTFYRDENVAGFAAEKQGFKRRSQQVIDDYTVAATLAIAVNLLHISAGKPEHELSKRFFLGIVNADRGLLSDDHPYGTLDVLSGLLPDFFAD